MRIKELLKKDFRLITEMERSSLVIILFSMFIAFVLFPILSAVSVETYFSTYSILFLIFLSFLLLQELWTEEVKGKAINILLSAGIDIKDIWVAKSTSAFAFSYFVMLAFAMIFVAFKGLPSTEAFLDGFVVQPILSFLLLLPVSAIFAVVKSYGYASLLSLLILVPFLILYYLWAKSAFFLLFAVLLLLIFLDKTKKISLEGVKR